MTPTDELAAVARAHAAAEARDDFETTMATLDDDPVYELLPIGLSFHGRDAASVYYKHFFAHVKPIVAGYELRNEWLNARGLAQEYVIDVRDPDRGVERHPVLSILTFGATRLSGERLYASEALLRLMFGPAFDLATPMAEPRRAPRRGLAR